jgi:tape measure domain-containing protein
MTDGSIRISVEVDGKQVNVVADDLEKLGDTGRQAGDGVGDTEDAVKKTGEESSKASGKVKQFATALGLVAIGAAAWKILRDSMDDAISRFDTLNTFPKVLQELGVSAEDSERAMTNLSDGIDGLPTKLDDIAATAQRMYTSFGDMDLATDSAIALNNALLGSGSSADQARRGTEQYIKALQTNKMEMDTWNTLSETMDVALVKVAESFGFAGRSAKSDLYEALRDGHITMDEFNAKLVEIGTGTGDMARLAKENSLGVGTSLQNLRTAVSRNLANVIDSFDRLSREVTGNSIAENIDGMKNVINAAFTVIVGAIDAATPVVKFFADGVKATIPVVNALTPAIIGLMAAYAAHAVITKASAAIQASNKILGIALASQKTLTVAKTADTAATAAQTGVISLQNVVIGVLTGRMKLATAAMIAKTAAAGALRTALTFLSGPVGWVTAGIGALVAGTVAIVKWFRQTSAEAEQLKEDTEALGEATDELNDGLESSAQAYADQQKQTRAAAEANEYLAGRVEDLASKENKSAAEKQMLNDYIRELNGSVNNLNLAYDEEANALNMSSEEIATRIGLMEEQTSYNDALERQVELAKEQAEVDQQLEEINALRERSNELYEQEEITKRENDKATLELDEKERALMETKMELAEQQKETEQQLTESMEAITAATEQGVAGQKIAFDDLSESQQKLVEELKSKWQDYKDAATNMFDTISDEVEITASEMADNLEENQRVISEWSENIATLAERGVDEGLLDTLREAGPESAGHVSALVNASDEELDRLSSVFSEGGDVATQALADSLGIEDSAVLDSIDHLVVDTEQSFREKINNAGFDTIGVDIADGLAEGIESGTPQAETAAGDMADATTDATREAFQTRSPSKVFEGIGKDLPPGLALGIQRATPLVVRAVRMMFTNIIRESDRQFNSIGRNFRQHTVRQRISLRSQFNSIGTYAMSGLRAGLNAGSGSVMATARSIANNVAATMRRALRIHSPSRVMRDDVGFEVPAGLAMGIRDNAKAVYKELESLMSGIMHYSTPEMALGTNQMAHQSQTTRIIERHMSASTGSTNTAPQTIHVEAGDVYMEGEKVGTITWRTVKKNIDRSNNRKRRMPKGGRV